MINSWVHQQYQQQQQEQQVIAYNNNNNKQTNKQTSKRTNKQQRRFLPRDAMHKRGLCCHPVSVCLSVCHVRGSRQNE